MQISHFREAADEVYVTGSGSLWRPDKALLIDMLIGCGSWFLYDQCRMSPDEAINFWDGAGRHAEQKTDLVCVESRACVCVCMCMWGVLNGTCVLSHRPCVCVSHHPPKPTKSVAKYWKT